MNEEADNENVVPVEQRGAILIISVNRPQAKNVTDPARRDRLRDLPNPGDPLDTTRGN